MLSTVCFFFNISSIKHCILKKSPVQVHGSHGQEWTQDPLFCEDKNIVMSLKGNIIVENILKDNSQISTLASSYCFYIQKHNNTIGMFRF